MMRKYDAKIEVGFIDLAKWKHALGQIICYGEFYPDHKKKIILFGELNFDINLAKHICSKFNVDVEIYE